MTRNAFLEYGLKIFGARDREVRGLKRIHRPSNFGFRIWTSSWLLMDFLRIRRIAGGSRIMDVGCGWGLAGIFCAKRYGANVTSVDMDAHVFPFLKLHAEANGVKVKTLTRRFGEIGLEELSGINILIGADICFWDTQVTPLISLIERAFEAGAKAVLLADPGRGTFLDLARHFTAIQQAEVFNWAVDRPYRINGSILAIEPLKRAN